MQKMCVENLLFLPPSASASPCFCVCFVWLLPPQPSRTLLPKTALSPFPSLPFSFFSSSFWHYATSYCIGLVLWRASHCFHANLGDGDSKHSDCRGGCLQRVVYSTLHDFSASLHLPDTDHWQFQSRVWSKCGDCAQDGRLDNRKLSHSAGSSIKTRESCLHSSAFFWGE